MEEDCKTRDISWRHQQEGGRLVRGDGSVRTEAGQAEGLSKVWPMGGDISLGVMMSHDGRADFGNPSLGVGQTWRWKMPSPTCATQELPQGQQTAGNKAMGRELRGQAGRAVPGHC